MSFIKLIVRYFFWHYTKAFIDFFRIWINIFWFCIHFFSMSTMIRTLFSPWKRIVDEDKSIGNFFSSFIVNMIMRVVGFVMRSTLIIAGIFAVLIVFILGIASLVLWIFTPIILLLIFIKGITLLFK